MKALQGEALLKGDSGTWEGTSLLLENEAGI